MESQKKKSDQKSKENVEKAHIEERGLFKTRLLANPNYYGNLVESPFKEVLPIGGNNEFEELVCVGYHPQQKWLEAIVYIYQPWGYGTDICGLGTPEYVRFYLSFDKGGTWLDEGMTSFQAYNIPEGTEGGKRLEYAVMLPADLSPKFCFFDPLIRVRAILSWNNPPPPNQPNWKPIWGNVNESTIQVEPFRLLPWPDLFEIGKLKLPPSLEEVIDFDTPIKTKTKSLGAVELSKLYKDKSVPLHRFAFKEISSFVSAKSNLSAEELSTLLPGITIDTGLTDMLIPETDGDIGFEELKCIGLDPNIPNIMVGVIQIKKPNGFSGGPCTDGSQEYVTFWADFDGNGSFETCLGTSSVRVYDLSNIPPEGVYYAVRLPVDLNPYRQACQLGPRVVKVRAILSWNIPASCANPNHIPVWGNREETLIHIAPDVQAVAGKIAILGGIPVEHIDNTSGLTIGTAVFATNNLSPDSYGRPCPFAGRVTVQGAPVLGSTYAVEVSQDGSIWTPVLKDLVVTDQFGNTSIHKADPVTKRFDYLPFTQNINGVLAQWITTGDTKWKIRLSIFLGSILQGTDTHVLQVGNTPPEASISITTGVGNCGKFGINTVLKGNYLAIDDYLGSYSLNVLPSINPGVGVPVPNSGLINTSSAPGNPWFLDTTGMQACGYIIRVVAVDRAIINSQVVGHRVSKSVGFCLE